MYDNKTVSGNEFLRRLKTLAKRTGTTVRFEPRKGKGSHGRVWFGDRRTTLKDLKAELGPGLLTAMCGHLGIDRNEL